MKKKIMQYHCRTRFPLAFRGLSGNGTNHRNPAAGSIKLDPKYLLEGFPSFFFFFSRFSYHLPLDISLPSKRNKDVWDAQFNMRPSHHEPAKLKGAIQEVGTICAHFSPFFSRWIPLLHTNQTDPFLDH